jgi:phosphoribosyl-dephospho-CoA transferase
MSGISVGMERMYEHEINIREKHQGRNYTTPVVVLTLAAVGAIMPTPMNLYVWGAGAAGLALAKRLENTIA